MHKALRSDALLRLVNCRSEKQYFPSENDNNMQLTIRAILMGYFKRKLIMTCS